ncbi:DUF6075 family protein [Trichococcus collinsii]|uniref:Uncharacterized protein n=1 Tax=Trichococcus collinsii TaxID=157076 RepID=A0AB37ZX59_9LACT|nr:DUF6075 family protein [Trichococcus collinsii]CZQ80475.1 Hypothetical protein Tcol_44 [Trichococcus collinsii]SDZ92635.1 hypothetical protein SAMN04488525_101639 [Trichococcus collinsii]
MYTDSYTELLIKDKTAETDVERKALFLILSNDDLFGKVTHLYDFQEHSIKPDSLDNGEVDLSSSSRKLVMAAFNLFNGHYTADIFDTFAGLDDENFDLVIQAIKIRFNKDK